MKDFEDLVKTIVNALDDEGQDRLREMEDWIIKNEGTWVLAEGFVSFLGKVLTDPAMPSEARVALLRLLAYGTGNDDIVLILHMDRKDHILMNYAQQCDRLPIREQEALALLVWNFSGKLAFFPGKILEIIFSSLRTFSNTIPQLNGAFTFPNGRPAIGIFQTSG